jgi:hypothetical protein
MTAEQFQFLADDPLSGEKHNDLVAEVMRIDCGYALATARPLSSIHPTDSTPRAICQNRRNRKFSACRGAGKASRQPNLPGNCRGGNQKRKLSDGYGRLVGSYRSFPSVTPSPGRYETVGTRDTIIPQAPVRLVKVSLGSATGSLYLSWKHSIPMRGL